MRGWGVAAFDYDNDGWVDVAAVGEGFNGDGRIVLLRNEGAAGFSRCDDFSGASTKWCCTGRAELWRLILTAMDRRDC